MLNCHKSIPAVHFCFLTFWHWGHYQSPFFQHDGHNLSQTVEDTNFLKVFWNLGLICCFWCQNDTMVHYIYWTCHLMKDLHFHFWHLYSIFFFLQSMAVRGRVGYLTKSLYLVGGLSPCLSFSTIMQNWIYCTNWTGDFFNICHVPPPS